MKRLKDRAAAATGPNRASAFVDPGGYWLVGAIVYQRAEEVAKNFRKKLALGLLGSRFREGAILATIFGIRNLEC